MSLQNPIDAALSTAVQQGRVPGVAMMVTDARHIRYQGAFGVRTLGLPQAMTVDTVGWIASMTKAITAAAAMQLVERGRLELDEPAFRRLPELARVPVLEGFDAQGHPITRAPRRPVTLRHLLTHTAGFGYDTWNPEVRRYQQAMDLPLMASGRRAALMTPLLFDPGQRWNYGIGIDWAGLLVEQASGLRLGEYLARELLGPLGMDSTGFALTAAMRARLARIHQRGEDGRLVPQHDFEIIQQPEFEGGGGGLYSSAADYLRFLRVILNDGLTDDGARVLRPETVDLMSRNHIGGLRVSPMRTLNPARSNDAEFFPGVPKSWGLSFQINEAAAPTGRPAGGLMWAGLSNCYYWIDRAGGIAGVFVSQVLPFADREALPLYLAAEGEVYRGSAAGG